MLLSFIVRAKRVRRRQYHCLVIRQDKQQQQLQELREALRHLEKVVLVDRDWYARLLRKCSDLGALQEGKLLHAHIAGSGLAASCYLGNLLVHMYGRCGCLIEAEQVFHGIAQRNVFSWSIMLSAFAQNGHFVDAFRLYCRLQLEGVEACKATFISMLICCSGAGQLDQGACIHSQIASVGWELDVQVATAIVNMYGKCGSLHRAKLVFDRMPLRDAVCWNTLMSIYVRRGNSQDALELYCHMNLEGTKANRNTLATIVEACGSSRRLVTGQQVHQHVLDIGLGADVVLTNCLVNMYAKCDCLEDAKTLFEELGTSRNLVSWNVMISAYLHNGFAALAFDTARRMWLDGQEPDKFTFLSMVEACHTRQDLQLVHSRISMASLNDVLVGTSLVKMYGKFGLLEAARDVFEQIGSSRDIICWNAMVAAYSQNRRCCEAVEMLWSMDLLGVKLNRASLPSILEACDLRQGRLLHERISAAGYESELLVGTALVTMYARCRRLQEARIVFGKIRDKDMLAWTSMIASAVDNGCPAEAVNHFQAMELEGFKANKVTLVCVVDACTFLEDAYLGEQIHDRISCSAWNTDTVVANSLIHMYTKCRMPDKAWPVFEQLLDRDVISWNAIMSAASSTMDVYRSMSLEGTKPDNVTFLSILEGFCSSESIEIDSTVDAARLVHSHMCEGGFQGTDMICTTLVGIYGKAGQLQNAKSVFGEIRDRTDVVSWNAMAAAYLESGDAPAVLHLLRELDAEGVKPDKVTLGVMLQACGLLADVHLVSAMHERVVAQGLEAEAGVGNTLVAVYGSDCANLGAAWQAFRKIRGRKNVATWNGMQLVLARHGQLGEMVELFRDMDLEGVRPNNASLTNILFVCNHAGLLLEGARCFCQMTSDHGIPASAAHYSCLIGLLGRAGWVNEAEQLIAGMPFAAGAFEWMALLSSGLDHEKLDQLSSRAAAQRVMELDPGCAAAYVSICNQLLLAQ